MLCSSPINLTDRGEVPCGQCLSCRINERRRKTGRLLLEHLFTWNVLGAQSSFATLTYSNESIPMMKSGAGYIPVLAKVELQKFLKRLRKACMPFKVRYAGVGEYGDRTGRPHYHLCLFGLGAAAEEVVRRAWDRGHVQVDELNDRRIQYLAGYTVKKWTKADNRNLAGRPPEFYVCSRRPGLGAGAAEILAKAYESKPGAVALIENGLDVGRTFRYQAKRYPLDDYMLHKIRGELGIPKLARDRPVTVARELATYEDIELRMQAENKARRRERRRGVF